MKVKVFATKTIEKIVDVPDKYKVLEDDDWVDNHDWDAYDKKIKGIKKDILSTLGNEVDTIEAIWTENEEDLLWEN